MLDTITPQALAQYHLERDIELPRLAERLSWLQGLPNISITVDNRERNTCRLTTDGIVLTINADVILQISLRHGFGTKDTLPLAMADMLAISHQMGRAQDFLDPSFFIESNLNSRADAQARRFFNATIDDVAITARIHHIPLLGRYLDAFISRVIDHSLLNLPLHIQFMSALRIIYGESRPELTIAPEIQKLTHDLMHAPAPASNRTRTSTPARAYTPALEALMAPGLTFKARRETADELFYPAFLSLLERDLIRYDSHLLRDLYDKVNPLGDSAASDSHLLNPSGAEATREDIEHFYTTTKDNLMEVTSAAMKDLGESTEQQDDGAPGLMLPRSGESPDELCVDSGESPSYLATVNQWRPTIRGVADALLKLALPQELIAVPRYRAHASVEGVRLHPSALPLAFIQLETENPQAIWQPVKQLIRHQELQFGGLDIYLLLDVSGSMGGANARFATATSLCLIEGLQVARLRAQREQTQGEVDVRVQILAFGAGWAPLTPLVREPTLAQKELAFFNLMHPRSNFTKVNGALKHVRASTLANPSRKVLCLIVSDGLFSDNLAAFKTMQNMPRRVYAGHINIGDAYGIPLTPHFETISNPKLLPQKLQSLLEEYRQKQPDG